tara:strand:+ start:262 stop:831 length:570 start_codon:yes stop_codon:yes gene_type:complete
VDYLINMIKSKNLEIEGVLLLEIPLFNDIRGSFIESFSDKINKILGINLPWIQDNESISNKNVFRGLHFQTGDFAQSKLIRVSQGKILDVMIDLRINSNSFKKLIVVKIESRNKMLYIPKGIAHGFLSLKDNTIVNYKCDNLYNPSYESGINPFISNINLDFGINEVDLIISDKDKALPSLDKSYNFEL